MARIVYKPRELDLFYYWINERHMIWVKRHFKQAPPWTDDKILRKYKFTNVFRQLDRVTCEWRKRYHELLKYGTISNGDILFQLCLFRFFNWPLTYDRLFLGFGRRWNRKIALNVLEEMRNNKLQIFTGAYIISSGGKQQPKYITMCDVLDVMWDHRNILAAEIVARRSMQAATEMLQSYNTVGPFVAYELACDLRHTRLLFSATDRLTWANAGPGAMRGIHRLLTGRAQKPKTKIDYNVVMVDLLKWAKYNLKIHVRDCAWPFELREIEHSLCEFDKYRRVARKEGAPRSLYKPKP